MMDAKKIVGTLNKLNQAIKLQKRQSFLL